MPWTVVLTRDGTRVARLTPADQGLERLVHARQVLANPAGADIVRAVAARSGESCIARATWTA